MIRNSSHADEFIAALKAHAAGYRVQLSAQVVARLCDYYELVSAWNTPLHLVAPCSPAEFATRHVLESLLAIAYIPEGAHVIDVGSGAGLPIIPCLIARRGLHATLFESSTKKAIFLREALQRTHTRNATTVIAERFERSAAPRADFVTCRALNRFTEIFPKLVAWSPHGSTLLLFGGHTLQDQIKKAALAYEAVHIPESERRFLFIVTRSPDKNRQE